MTKLVVTHAGEAHRDDLLCTALALALGKAKAVVRRDPTPEELDSPDVLVVDVGGQYDPEKNNFDHHQRGRDETPECALSLWARHVEYEGVSLHELLSMTLWFDTTVKMDVQEPFQVAKQYDLAPDQLLALGSPIERTMLRLFSEGLLTLDVLTHIGKELLTFLHRQYVGVEQLRQLRHMVDIRGTQVTVLDTQDIKGLGVLRRQEGVTGGIRICHDDRGDGWALYRFDDDARVDFSRLGGHPDILFAHPGGFIAKTKERLDLSAVLALAEKAII